MFLHTDRNNPPAIITRRQFTLGSAATVGLVAAAPSSAMQALVRTAESPMGPFYPVERIAEADMDLTRLAGHGQRAAGTVIEIAGRVLDLRGNAVPGALVELWQANAAGRYAHPADIATAPLDPHFQGFAALKTDARGNWRIITVKPGGYGSPIGQRPPHIHFAIQGRRDRTIAQLYFPEDAKANAKDQLYRALGGDAATSLATRDAADPNRYRWDIILVG